MKKRRVLFVSLGCPKNQVDGELMLAKLQNAGFENADNFERLDAVIVNTCAFIDSAKQEAIDTILEMVGLKKDGLVRAVIVTGCLAERYQKQMDEEVHFSASRIRQSATATRYFRRFPRLMRSSASAQTAISTR